MHIHLNGLRRMSRTSDDMLTPNLYLKIEDGTLTIGASLSRDDPNDYASLDDLEEIRGELEKQGIPFEPLTHSMGTDRPRTVVTAVRLRMAAPDDGK
jgi:hypothetical protein